MSSAPRDLKALAVIFATSGVIHLLKPEVYEPIMPKLVPAHREVIYGSGVLELVCAAGLLHPRTRAASGWVSLVVLLSVYPANIKLAVDSTRTSNTKVQAASFARLPMQFPMLRTAYRAARGR